MSAKQLADFAFADNAGNLQDSDSRDIYRLDDIESFINASKSRLLDDYLADINQWLAQLGMENNRIEWWSFNAATRNPLASRLIYRLLAFRCCIEKISSAPRTRQVVLENVPASLKRAVAGHFDMQLALPERIRMVVRTLSGTLTGMVKITGQLFQAWRVTARYPAKKLEGGGIALFTFVDGSARDKGDAYFGTLAETLATKMPATDVEHVAYVYRPYLKRIAGGEIDLSSNNSLLLSYLSFRDYVVTWLKFMVLAIRPTRPTMPPDAEWGVPFGEILADTLRQEVSRGAVENYLIFRAFRRLANTGVYSRIIYPFENKALEKCLILALCEATEVTTIGYQHSSITRRHFALQLFPGEFGKIPMPDRIITVGDVTRNWLVTHGFPAGKVVTGCSLRHNLDFNTADARPAHEPPHILFALSSSKYELETTVSFMKTLKASCGTWELGIRCHPNFPVSILDEADRTWLATNATVFSGSTLASNLEWADVVGYVSSTVVLEALAAGKAIIRLDIEALNPDPLLEPPAFHHICGSPESFKKAVEGIRSRDDSSRKAFTRMAQAYVRSYLMPYTEDVVKEFVS